MREPMMQYKDELAAPAGYNQPHGNTHNMRLSIAQVADRIVYWQSARKSGPIAVDRLWMAEHAIELHIMAATGTGADPAFGIAGRERNRRAKYRHILAARQRAAANKLTRVHSA